MNTGYRFSLLAALLLLLLVSPSARAGDYLNEQEAERVRDAQEIDRRTAVFLKIAERRLNVLAGVTPAAAATEKDKPNKKDKKDKKELEQETAGDYGGEPTGTTAELLENYTRVISELLDKLDDNFERKKNSPALAKALDKLLAAGEQHLARLNQLRAKIKSSAEESALEKAIEIAKMAIDGARSFKTQQ